MKTVLTDSWKVTFKSNPGTVMFALPGNFSIWLISFSSWSIAFGLFSTPVVYAQTANKNRQDEKRENERVDKARKELGQSQSELKKLQGELQQKSQAFVAARGAFLQAKKKSEAVHEQAEERVGESLGIPAQMQVVRGASMVLQDKTKEILEKLKTNSTYAEISQRMSLSEKALANGFHPTTQQPLGTSAVDQIESSIASDKKELRAIEDAAISGDLQAMEAKEDLQDAQKKLKEMKSKLSPSRIDNDFAYKKAKAETDQALKKMQAASANLQKAEVALQKKANEMGSDYQAYMRAKQADAADANRTNPSKKKPAPKPAPKKSQTKKPTTTKSNSKSKSEDKKKTTS
ncbi:MAG: hypothetical protein RLZZ396_3167 [Planctomycetota bacterium]